MNKEVKRIFILAAGCIFLVLGIVGLALPFLQGFLFIAIGLILLSISSSRVRRLVSSHTVKYPKVHAMVEKLEAWVVRIIGRVDEEEPHSGENQQAT